MGTTAGKRTIPRLFIIELQYRIYATNPYLDYKPSPIFRINCRWNKCPFDCGRLSTCPVTSYRDVPVLGHDRPVWVASCLSPSYQLAGSYRDQSRPSTDILRPPNPDRLLLRQAGIQSAGKTIPRRAQNGQKRRAPGKAGKG